MVLRPEQEAEAEAIFTKWGLDFAIVGKTTDDLRFRVLHQGEEVANLPIKELGDEAPEYDRPWIEPKAQAKVDAATLADIDIADALLKLLGSANGSSRRWVWEQYDTLIQGNSLQIPGGDAGVVRVDGHEAKALAFSSDVTPRYVEADPFEGGKQAVAECWRNITATGAKPLAATDNLNFGNPERPEIMGQFVKAIQGIGEACRVLDFPIVSGNVSLYNETNGEAILPTPTIAGVGLIDDWRAMARTGFSGDGEVVLLIGAPEMWGTQLGASALLREVHGCADGAPPPVDLDHERRAGDFVRGLISDGLVSAVHDCSTGGLAMALAEMAIAGQRGAVIGEPGGECPQASYFGEDQGRYCVTAGAQKLDSIRSRASSLDVSVIEIGTTGGDQLKLGNARAISVQDLKAAHESWFPRFMGEQ